MHSILLLLFLSCTLIHTAHAVYFDVNTCTEQTPCVFASPTGSDSNNGTIGSPFRSIQKALASLASATIPSTIVLADGTYPPNVMWSGHNITLTSINGASSTFIDCNQVANIRGIWIGSGETSSTIISGLTIHNCATTMGSGMAIVGVNTRPIVKDMIFINNLATVGGGISVLFASPTLININITNNLARNGAGIAISHDATLLIPAQLQAMTLALNYVAPPNTPLPNGVNAYVNMTNIQFQGNTAIDAGASILLLAGYRVSCINCICMRNNGAGAGCIAAASRSTVSVINGYFANNIANTLNGGAISIQQGSIGMIKGATFYNNSAYAYGGGVAVGTQGTVTVMNSTFDSNTAPQGSIVYNDATSRATVTGCITRNNVASQQGGIYLNNPISVANFIPTSNTYDNNKALYNYGADYASYPSSLAFILPENSTDLGYSGISPSILPMNTSIQLSRSTFNLDVIVLKVLLLDTFGQRVDLNASNQTNLYADIRTIDNMTIPALLVQSTRVTMPGGLALVEIQVVGEMEKTYAVTWYVDVPNVAPIRLFVTIKPCASFDVITYYEGTNFPICHAAQAHTISTSLFQGILVISCILIFLVLIVQGLTIWYWSTPVFKGSTPLFMSLMLVGAIIGYMATILSVVDVSRTSNFDAVCKSQYWLMGVAFALMFATLALKTWRIRNIFCNETLTDIRSMTNAGLLRILGLVLALEILIHLLWILIDPLKSTLVLSTNQLSYTCESQHDNIFLIVNLVYNGLIALTCVIFAYQTRDVASRFNESRQLMIASYNMFVCVIVIAALSLALPSVDARRAVYSVGSLFVITSTWFVLFTPKLYLAIFKSSYNTSTGLQGGLSEHGKNSNSGGKNSKDSNDQRKISTAKSTQGPLSSKSSFNNQNIPMATTTSSACATPTRSKANSAANTAPGSPAIHTHKLALNLGQNRASITGSPVIGMASPIGGSPPFAAAVARHLSTTSMRAQLHEDMVAISQPHDIMVELEPIDPIDQSPFAHARRTSQPTLYGNVDILTTLRASSSGNGLSPARNFI